MTTPLRPAEIFDAAVAAWRPVADAEYSPELVDEILRKHRHHLIRLIEEQTSPVLSLSQAVIERRLEDEAAELRRIRQVAVDPHALYHLALRLEEIAAPTQKTPEEILEYFRRHGFERISDLIATYLRTGGPVGPLLRSVAAQLRVGDEHDAVIVRDPGEEDESMAVPEDTLLGVDRDWRVGDHGHVLRQDPEGVSLHDIELLGEDLDEQGRMTAYVRVKPGRVTCSGCNLRGGSSSLKHGDRLIRRDLIASPSTQPYGHERLERHWEHFSKLASALRRSPLELERTRQLIAYAGVLVAAPSCRGRARAVAARAVGLALLEHKAAAHEIESGRDQLAAERLTRVARYVARAAHELASACAKGQIELVQPLTAPTEVPEGEDQPTAFELTLAPYAGQPGLTPEAVETALGHLREHEDE
jgi:hypothetical protein